MNQFDYPWFGSWINALLILGVYILCGGIVLWNLRGGSGNPYLSHDDKVKHTRYMVRHFSLICVAVTVYAVVTILLQAMEMNEQKQLAMTVYAQFLSLAYFIMMLKPKNIDFSIYKNSAPV